jgi:hypothetical protein
VELQPDCDELPRAERQWRAVTTLAWPAVLGGAPLLLSRLSDVPVCAFRGVTGQPCPLCGGTRACAALVDGNFLAAWQLNPGLLMLLALAFAHTAQLAYEALTARRVSERWRIGARLWAGAGIVLLTLWVMRLLGWG